jgi:hypothetical protein
VTNEDETISKLVEAFQASSAWQRQSEILAQVSKLAAFRHRRLIETLSPFCVSPFVSQRLKGITRRLDRNEQLRLAETVIAQRSPAATSADEVAIRAPEPDAQATPPNVELSGYGETEFEVDACNLSSEDQLLLRRTTHALIADAPGVKLRELKRGFSGSDVYHVKIKKTREGRSAVMPKSFVAKIGDAQKLRSEYLKAQEACTLSSAHPTIFRDDGTRGCLLQEFASTSFADDSTTSFRTALSAPYRQKAEARSISKILLYLSRVNEEILARHNLKVETKKSVTEATKTCAEQIRIARLEARLQIIGISGSECYIQDKFRLELLNPLWYLLKLQDKKPVIKYFDQPLHGDLHTENIQIDSDDVAHAIDWGNFSKGGHSSLDHALLETSVWAHCASHDLLIEELDRAMCEIPFPGELGSLEVDPSDDDANALTRCKLVVKRIREQASAVLYSPKPFDYAIGLFFCAVQQLQYEDANLRAMLLLANQAIRRLEEEWGPRSLITSDLSRLRFSTARRN